MVDPRQRAVSAFGNSSSTEWCSVRQWDGLKFDIHGGRGGGLEHKLTPNLGVAWKGYIMSSRTAQRTSSRKAVSSRHTTWTAISTPFARG
jgi:hypothetical protein